MIEFYTVVNLGGAIDARDVQRAVSQMPHCPHTVITVIEKAGHDIHLDQPEACLTEIKQFLTREWTHPGGSFAGAAGQPTRDEPDATARRRAKTISRIIALANPTLSS